MPLTTMPQDRSAGTIAEEHAGVAIRPIDDARKLFGSDDKDSVVGIGGNKLLRNFDSVEKSGASGAHVETRCIDCTDLSLHETRRAREKHVRRDRGDNDEINVLGSDPGVRDGCFGGFRREIARGLIIRGDSAFVDAGARNDPFGSRLYGFLQFGVGEHFFRDVTPRADDRDRALRQVGSGAWLRLTHNSALLR